jgi:hypothetical protein
MIDCVVSTDEGDFVGGRARGGVCADRRGNYSSL